jgi:hypothetical protein
LSKTPNAFVFADGRYHPQYRIEVSFGDFREAGLVVGWVTIG